VTHLAGSKIVNPDQGGGYLCDVGSPFSPGTGKCTKSVLQAKTDADGHVFLRYWAPAASDDISTEISANAHKCLSTCPGASGDKAETLIVVPHITYEVPKILLGSAERKMLVDWHDHIVGLTDNADLAAVDKMLKRVASTAKDPTVAAALGQLAKGVPLFGPMADFGVLEWFAGKFDIVDTGLMELDSSVVADIIADYLKAPFAASPALTKIKKYLGLSETYRELLPPLLDKYASWLGPAASSLKQFMTLKLEEASYCGKLVDCTTKYDVPVIHPWLPGIHDNLYLALSSVDETGLGQRFFKDLNATSGYNPLDWIPDQCQSAAGCNDKP